MLHLHAGERSIAESQRAWRVKRDYQKRRPTLSSTRIDLNSTKGRFTHFMTISPVASEARLASPSSRPTSRRCALCHHAAVADLLCRCAPPLAATRSGRRGCRKTRGTDPTYCPPGKTGPVIRLPCPPHSSRGRGGFLQLLCPALSPRCPHQPRRSVAPHRSMLPSPEM